MKKGFYITLGLIGLLLIYILIQSGGSDTSSDIPTVDYDVYAGEPYRADDGSGFSYRVVVPAGTGEAVLRQVAEYEAIKRRQSYDEITIFFYIGHDPNDDQNFAADAIYEWYRRTNTVRKQ